MSVTYYISTIAFSVLLYCYCSYHPSNKPLNYRDYVVSRIIRAKEGSLFQTQLEKSFSPKLFLSEDEFWEEKFFKVGWLEDQIEELLGEIQDLRYQLEEALEKLEYFAPSSNSGKQAEEEKESLSTQISLLEPKIPKLKEKIVEGKRELTKLSYYRFDYWPFLDYTSDTLTLYLQNTDFFLNTHQPTLKHLTKQIGFDLPIVIERSLLDDKKFIKETPTPEALINKVLSLASELMQTITSNDEGNDFDWVKGKKIPLYRFQLPRGNNLDDYIYAQAFYHRDFRGKKSIVVTSQFIPSRDFSQLLLEAY